MSNFTDDLTHTRGTGATRINPAGLIVGVDFSSTSVTIGTGAKTFTLTADANVNRDWPVGSAVRVVDQVSANTMEGTVTTYTPSTQELVLNITTVSGAGTFTNWRIGSLEVRRDADGVLREPLRTNSFKFSEDFGNAYWGKSGCLIFSDLSLAPNGSLTSDKLVMTVGTDPLGTSAVGLRPLSQAITSSVVVYSIYAKTGEFKTLAVRENLQVGSFLLLDLLTGAISYVGGSSQFPNAKAENIGGGWFRLTWTSSLAVANTDKYSFRSGGSGDFGDGSSGIYLWGAQVEAGSSSTSYIPTTTVAVTRNADTFTFTPAAIAKFRQGQGALVVEANASDAGTAQRTALRLTGPSGEIRFGKQGVATSGNFTKMAEGGDVQLLGNATQGVTNNGLEYGAFNPVLDRTGVVLGAAPFNAVTYNGTNQFGAVTTTAETLINSSFSTLNAVSIGNITLNGCHYNGSRFLIATGVVGAVGISTYGLSYRSVNTPVITRACTEVTSGLVGATLRNVIVGNNGFIAYSDNNGETWVASTPINSVFQCNGVTHTGSRFVLVATGGVGPAFYSTDGVTWTQSVTTNLLATDVHFSNSILVSVGIGGRIFTSVDGGTNWTAATSSQVVTTQTLNGVHYNASANLWVAVGNGGTIITATDPTGTWTLQTSGVAVTLNEVGYFNGLWIVAAAAGNQVLTSPNAVNWTSRATGVSSGFIGIAASPTRLIITGSSGGFASSEDGLTYTSRTNNNATLNGIAYGAGVYLSVGNAVNGSGYIATIDGAGTVTRRVSGTASSIRNVKFVNGAFYAPHGDLMLRSVDGVTWANTTISLPMAPSDITIGNGLFVLVGLNANRRYATSTDGINFTVRDIVATSVLQNAVDFANGVFVSVGNTGTILTGVESSGSVTWTLRTSGTTQNLTSVMFSTRDQRWYAAGTAGTLLYSEDNGVTWASVNNAGFGAVSNTTLQANKLLPQWKTGRNTMALSYKANEVIVGLNGVATTDTTASIPSITGGVLGESFNGKIGPAYFYEFPKTLAEIIAITGVTR